MTKGEARELKYWEDVAHDEKRRALNLEKWLLSKHPEILNEYNDYRLAQTIFPEK